MTPCKTLPSMWPPDVLFGPLGDGCTPWGRHLAHSLLVYSHVPILFNVVLVDAYTHTAQAPDDSWGSYTPNSAAIW